eukprot:5605043-Pyramimonas_sp.AAC.1
MRAVALGPSVGLPMGPRSPALGVAGACGLRHWSLWWGTLWGHEALCWVRRTHAGCATEAF